MESNLEDIFKVEPAEFPQGSMAVRGGFHVSSVQAEPILRVRLAVFS